MGMGCKGCCGLLAAPQPCQASVYSLPEALVCYMARFAHQGLGLATTFTGFPSVQLFLSQMISDIFAYKKKRDANKL